jgi:hypothetical protein
MDVFRNCSRCGERMLSQDKSCYMCGVRNEDWEVFMGISPTRRNGCFGVLLFIPLMFFTGIIMLF